VSYSIVIDEGRRLVRVVVSEIFKAETAPRMSTEARRAAVERGFNILYDVRVACDEELKRSDVFWWPRRIDALKAPEARRIRAAVLHLGKHRDIVAFLETVYRNVGLQACGFEDEAAALGWLGVA
jgi:hypothetical protein